MWVGSWLLCHATHIQTHQPCHIHCSSSSAQFNIAIWPFAKYIVHARINRSSVRFWSLNRPDHFKWTCHLRARALVSHYTLLKYWRPSSITTTTTIYYYWSASAGRVRLWLWLPLLLLWNANDDDDMSKWGEHLIRDGRPNGTITITQTPMMSTWTFYIKYITIQPMVSYNRTEWDVERKDGFNIKWLLLKILFRESHRLFLW